ncbi:pyridoxal phosphate-dependent aminotransferase [Pantoea ananatis]|uniref:pyridoxal phosphate-dependent aminotransferase n=1 Tax=Pantoea ananas TaxID=553 RepID=UPI0009BE52EB|nr:aminotransferase class I/II-fold pyridoxal phosphate-dependent enzyme [Pantoea ananatis]MDJ0029811.1 aminotransferase class I/II-fold pyridoxal phosphate-dependent enzyme [Pantoea ananatis]MDJ0045378.1 aminotransferase class I/II-fold pyridoxal phosphate-dependent enzyme [Pantoea ananatis]
MQFNKASGDKTQKWMGIMFSNRTSNIKGSKNAELDIIKNEKIKNGEVIIDLSKGEVNAIPPKVFIDNACRAINKNLNFYTESIGLEELREKLSQYASEHLSNDYIKNNIAVTSGAKSGLYNSLMALVNPGEEVIILAPYWSSFYEQIVLLEAIPVLVDSLGEDDLSDKIKEKITDKTKLIIVNTPHNPTGKVLDEKTLSKIINCVVERNLYVVMDVSYQKLTYEKKIKKGQVHLTKNQKEKVIFIDSFSKAWCITGWRIGYVCADEKIITKIKAIQTHTSSNPNCIAQYALLWSIDDVSIEEHQNNLINELIARRNLVLETFSSIEGVKMIYPEAGFFAFIDVKESPRWKRRDVDIKEICLDMFNECSVLVVPGTSFGNEKMFRLSFGGQIEKLKDGLEAIKKYLKK